MWEGLTHSFEVALTYRKVSVIRGLIGLGLDINAQDSNGNTRLHNAVKFVFFCMSRGYLSKNMIF